MKSVLPLALLAFCLSGQVHGQAQTKAPLTPPVSVTPAASEAEIRAVVEDFRTAIIAKDKARFLKLFHGMAIPWLAVADDPSLARIRQRNAKAPKAQPLGTPGPEPFIDFVVSSPLRIEEKFSNIRVHTDGEIGSVFFDYSFHEGDYVSNWGTEAWHLVNTGSGWKINSVIYSMTVNPEPAPKPASKPAAAPIAAQKK
jgi:hypothetical protein